MNSILIENPKSYSIDGVIHISEEHINKLDQLFNNMKATLIKNDMKDKCSLNLKVILKLKDGRELTSDNATILFARDEAKNVAMDYLIYSLEIKGDYLLEHFLKLEIDSDFFILPRIMLSRENSEHTNIDSYDFFCQIKNHVDDFKKSSFIKLLMFPSSFFFFVGSILFFMFCQITHLWKILFSDIKIIETIVYAFISGFILLLIYNLFIKKISIEMGAGKKQYKTQNFLLKKIPIFLLLPVVIGLLLKII